MTSVIGIEFVGEVLSDLVITPDLLTVGCQEVLYSIEFGLASPRVVVISVLKFE